MNCDSQKNGSSASSLGVGWYVAICIGAGAICGVWIDSHFGLTPVSTLVGVFVGIAAAVAGMYRMLMAVLSYIAEESQEGDP